MPPRAGPRPPPPARPRWPGGCARRPASLWNRQIVVFPGELPFPFGQIRFAHRDHEAPVLSDRAALEPGHDQVQPLEFHAGNPDGGVHVPLTAPDDHVAAQLVAEQPRDDRPACDDTYNDYDRGDCTPPRHVAIMAPCRPDAGARAGGGWTSASRRLHLGGQPGGPLPGPPAPPPGTRENQYFSQYAFNLIDEGLELGSGGGDGFLGLLGAGRLAA